MPAQRYPLTRTIVVAALVSGVLYCRPLDVSLAFLGFSFLCLAIVWIVRGQLVFPRLFSVSLLLTVLPLYFGILVASSHCERPGSIVFEVLANARCEQLIAVRAASNRASMLVLGYAWVNSLSLPDVVQIIRQASRVFGRKAPIVREVGLTAVTAYLRFVSTLRITYESLVVRATRQRTLRRRLAQWVTLRRLQLYATLFQLSRTIQSLAYASSQASLRAAKEGCAVDAVNAFVAGPTGQGDEWTEQFAVSKPGVTLFRESATAPRPYHALTLSGYLPRIEGDAEHFRADYTCGSESISSRNSQIDRITDLLSYAARDFALVHALPTVREQLAAGASDRAGTAELARDFGLERLLDTSCLELSGGETVLVSLGSTLLSPKHLLIADAPLDALSESRQEAVRSAVQRAVSAGKACLFEQQYQRALNGMVAGNAQLSENDRLRIRIDPEVRDGPGAAPRSKVVLAARDLEVRRGARTLLTGVSFELEAGSLIGLRGENGIGKTTLLKMLAGLLPTTTGHIERRGVVHMSFQQSAEQLVARTVQQELLAVDELNATDASGLAERYAALRNHMPLPDIDSSTEDLAPADRRWLCIASMLPAGVLLVDEPNVDWQDDTAENVIKLGKLCRSIGFAVLTVSHSDELLRFCDAVLDARQWIPQCRPS